MSRPFPLSAGRGSLAVALLALSLGAAAQTSMGSAASGTTAAAPASPVSLSHGDRSFVEKAARGGMAEVALSRIAQTQATHPQVKDFAARMVQDHTKAGEELARIATGKGAKMPPDAGHGNERDAEKLGKMTGADLDKTYMKHMVDDHKKTVKLFEKESQSGKDPQLKDFATRTLPTLQEHLQMALTTAAAVNGK